jgi:hypothetical protein
MLGKQHLVVLPQIILLALDNTPIALQPFPNPICPRWTIFFISYIKCTQEEDVVARIFEPSMPLARI